MGKSFRKNRKKMVVKTDVCHFSELKIYPGHGVKIITREGKINIYLHKKARRMAQRKIKAQRIKWTTAWRRMNKKVKTADITKKKRKKAKRVVREIAGMTAEEINRRKHETADDRDARKQEAIRQIKERKARIAKTAKPQAQPTKQFAKPKAKAAKR